MLLHDNPIRYLWKVDNGRLYEKALIVVLEAELEKGLKKVAMCRLLLSILMWPLSIYYVQNKNMKQNRETWRL